MDRNEAVSREEAVRTISRISGGSVSYAEDLYDSFFPKPVVPQYVADWYEANKDEFEINLFQSVYEASDGYTLRSRKRLNIQSDLSGCMVGMLISLINILQTGVISETTERRSRITYNTHAKNLKKLVLNGCLIARALK